MEDSMAVFTRKVLSYSYGMWALYNWPQFNSDNQLSSQLAAMNKIW